MSSMRELAEMCLAKYRTQGLKETLSLPASVYGKPRLPKGVQPPKDYLEQLGNRPLGEVTAAEYAGCAITAIAVQQQGTVSAITATGDVSVDATASKNTHWTPGAAREIAGNLFQKCLMAGCPPVFQDEIVRPKAEEPKMDEGNATVSGGQSAESTTESTNSAS